MRALIRAAHIKVVINNEERTRIAKGMVGSESKSGLAKSLLIILMVIVIIAAFSSGFGVSILIRSPEDISSLGSKLSNETLTQIVPLTETSTETRTQYPGVQHVTAIQEVVTILSQEYITSGNCTNLLVNAHGEFQQLIMNSTNITNQQILNVSVVSTTISEINTTYFSGECTTK
jgi:hypothetical protein